MKNIIICDMDNTLCDSCQDISQTMKKEIERLVNRGHIFVILGGSKPEHLYQQVCRHINVPVYVLGNSGTIICEWDGKDMKEVFTDSFSEDNRKKIIKKLENLTEKFNLIPLTSKEDQIQDRITQITLSILGRNAPSAEKEYYDPDKSKRKIFVNNLKTSLPEFEINIGGNTSIDITKKGRNKGGGILNFCKLFDYNTDNCIFLGDGIFPGGNDYSVIGVVDYIKVNNPDDTLREFRRL